MGEGAANAEGGKVPSVPEVGNDGGKAGFA